jgi:hypothetical protein
MEEISTLSKQLIDFIPRLVHSVKSPGVFDDSSLSNVIGTLLGSRGIVVVGGCYDTLIPLLGTAGEGYVTRVKGLEKKVCGLPSIYQFLEERWSSVWSWLRSIVDFGLLHGFSWSVQDDTQWKYFLHKYFLYSIVEMGETILKKHINYLFMKFHDQPDLESFISQATTVIYKERLGVLIGGKFNTWIKRKLLKSNRRAKCLIISLLQIKRAWSPISRKQVGATLVKHRTAMSQIESPDGEDPSNLDDLEREVIRTVCEVFPKKKISTYTDLVPSQSSHFDGENELSRSNGGALMYRAKYSLLHQGNPCYESRSPELLYVLYRGPKVSPFFVFGIFQDSEDRNDWFSRGRSECMVHVVLEPAKARIITAGDPDLYHRCRQIQKKVHGILRRHPTFHLTGGPVTKEVIMGYLKNFRMSQPDWNFSLEHLSGDYSQATDLLNPHLTKVAASAIAKRLGFDFGDEYMYLRSLVGSVLHYPERSSESFLFDRTELGTHIDQTWGQLMGSPSSFPILCIINAAVNRYVFEKVMGYRTSLVGCPMLVNGDDVLLGLPRASYQVWWDTVRRCGLEPSPGKNYISPDFLMINSEYWTSEGDFIPFINQGLLDGKSRVLSDTRREFNKNVEVGDVQSITWKLVNGHEPRVQDMIMETFITRNRSLLSTLQLPGQNWFIPSQLGGMGLPPTRDVKVTRGQGKLAAGLLHNPDASLRLGNSTRKAVPLYLSLAKQQEQEFLKGRKLFWSSTREDTSPSFALNWSALNFDIDLEEEFVDNRLGLWNALWRNYTNNNHDPMSLEECRLYRTRYPSLKQPAPDIVPNLYISQNNLCIQVC